MARSYSSCVAPHSARAASIALPCGASAAKRRQLDRA
jgi:hypothetical protein